MTYQEVLYMLWKVDDGYKLTDKERVELSDVDTLFLDDIEELPKSISILTELKVLSTSGHSSLKELPESIGCLKNLIDLNLSDTQIRELPSSIGKLSKLENLSLVNTQISMLPESIGKLSSLERIDLCHAPIEVLPESIGYLSNLKTLNLFNTNISILPKSFENLSSIQYISLTNTQIKELPDWMKSLNTLQTLKISYTQISELPDWIGNLRSLKWLDLTGTLISLIPESIIKLWNLSEIFLNATMKGLAGWIEKLNGVKEINLYLINEKIESIDRGYLGEYSPEKLEKISKSYSSYMNEKTDKGINLHLYYSHINELLEPMRCLVNVNIIYLNGDDINDIIDLIGDCNTVKVLDLTNTQITELPESSIHLNNLQELYLTNTQISDLPVWIGKFKYLETLNLAATSISTLPESIGNMSSLRDLNLLKSKICMIPKAIEKLKNLESLDLDDTQISELPKSIGSLNSLQQLYLRNTQIRELPESIGNLSKLGALYLGNTLISELPKSVGKISSLYMIDLSGTYINELPDSIKNLNNLVSLDLRGTQISEVPDCLRFCKRLQELYLNKTQISELPEWIGDLKNLRVINLSETNIRKLPDSIGDLQETFQLIIEDICLEDLPKNLLSLNTDFKNKRSSPYSTEPGIFIHNIILQKQPISLFSQPRELILKYYDSDKVEIKESRVIFMGDGGAGKSYTIQRIINRGELLETDTDVTHDISIENWNNQECIFDYDGSIDFWDFGGQDIYLSMHKCFLTERSCYVIVLCNRQYGSQRGLMRQARYWLKNISAFAKNSPILIAVNTWSSMPRDGLSLTQLQREFSKLNIVGQIVYDAHDPDNSEFNRLTSRICKMAQENYSYGLQFPISWNNVRTRFRNEYSNEYYISEREYYKICQEEMLEHDGYYDEEIARWLLHWFNDLGYCFNYHNIDEKLVGEEYQVLKPQWVIRAMYKIINHKIRQISGNDMLFADMLPLDLAKSTRYLEGRISKDDIIELLTEKSEYGNIYSEQEAEYIIRVLRTLKLAYLIEDSESEDLFIPAMCSDLRPDTFDKVDTKYVLKIEYLIRFGYLPDTVMQHLMIKCFQEGKRLQKVWKNGFHQKVMNGCILVEMLDDTEIVIKLYELAKNNVCYGLHEMRSWLAEIYNDIGIETTKDYIIKRTPRQKALINVKALLNAYIANPQMSLFYTQDDEVYEGHSVVDLLKGLYGSSYREIIETEASRNKEQGGDTVIAPEELSNRLSYLYIAGIIEDRFRTQFPKQQPLDEKDIQDHLQMFLDALGYMIGKDYVRESGRVLFATREYIPDFALIQSKTVIEVKFLKDGRRKSNMIEEMNADYSAYTKDYNSIIFLVYDLGTISDVEVFKRDFEDKGNVKVVVIKH